MHEAALTAIDLGKGGTTSPRRTANNNHADQLLSLGASMGLFPQAAHSSSMGVMIEEAHSSLSPAETHCLALPRFAVGRHEVVSAGRCCD